MKQNMYHIFLTGSQIWWKKPSPSAYTTCAVVLVPEEDLEQVRQTLKGIRRRVKGRLRPFLYKRRAGEFGMVVAELSRLLGRFQSYTFESPEAEDRVESFDKVLPDVLRKIDSVLGELDAKGTLYSNFPSLLGVWPPGINVRELCGVGPDREELLLAEFADWTYGQHLWQNAVLAHYHGEVTAFEDWIRAYPLLGGYHPLAASLIGQIERAPAYTVKQETWFRGRHCREGEVLDSSKMGPPPPEVTTEGRYNHAGQPVLYLASDEATCAAEIVDGPEATQIWVQKFEVLGKRLLDLTFYPNLNNDLPREEPELLMAALHNAIGHSADHRSAWKPEYYVTRFIADIVRWKGFDGIRFNSTRGGGINLVVFNWASNVAATGNPISFVYAYRRELQQRFPKKHNVYGLPCPYCGTVPEELSRLCTKCGRVNPQYDFDVDS